MQVNSHQTFEPPVWYKQFWPWFLMGLPASVVVACGFTIYLALSSPFALVSDDYYKDGLGINRNLDQVRVAQELGIEASVTIALQGIWVDLNLPETKLQNLELIHATDPSKDMGFVPEQIGPLRYNIELDTGLMSELRESWSLYKIRLTGADGNNRFWALSGSKARSTHERGEQVAPTIRLVASDKTIQQRL